MTESLNPTPDFLSKPTFMPRVTQHDGRAIEEALAATLFDQGVRLRAATVEATYAATDPPVLKRLREDGVARLVEPQTQRFTTRRFCEVEQLASLPYAPSEPITAANFNAGAARSLAVGALRFEQDQLCEHYLSAAVPFYDQDFQRWVAHNDRLLEESCSANGGAEIDRRPLIAQVFPGRAVLKQPEFVVNRLLDYPIGGAYVQPLLFDPVRDSPEKLRLYVEFLLAIAGEGIPVIASRIGAFGLVLAALGINTFDSGLAQAEASNLAQLNRPLTERERERRREGKGRWSRQADLLRDPEDDDEGRPRIGDTRAGRPTLPRRLQPQLLSIPRLRGSDSPPAPAFPLRPRCRGRRAQRSARRRNASRSGARATARCPGDRQVGASIADRSRRRRAAL